MQNPTRSNHLVVVGSSAGGVDALSVLVSSLPEGFLAPIVIAQHLAPTHPSRLKEILEKRSAMPVRVVTDQEVLEAGVIYVVPANRHISIDGHHISLHNDSRGRPKPSIDLLFSTAAEVYGDRLTAVILSGTGTDGANGARAVKRLGGTVIIQNPDTASFSGMPAALAPTVVDIVAELEKIGPVLRDLLGGIEVPSHPDEKRALEAFLGDLQQRSGIDFRSYKTPTIMRRLKRRMIATESNDLDSYIKYLEDHPDEYQQLVNSFLIKVTEFFRDLDLFTYLRDVVIPELVEHARNRGKDLRIWSAGCATGEEAYTLAMLVSEVLDGELDRFNVRIFATDLDSEAIEFARQGTYSVSALAHLPEQLVTRYFTRDDDRVYVRKRIRSMTVFGQHDLAKRAPFPHIDMVVCRNVLIYFTSELQQHALRLFAYSLRDTGYLVLGKAETVSPMTDLFGLQDKQFKVYRRQGERTVVPPTSSVETTPMPTSPRRALPDRRNSGKLAPPHTQRDVQRVRAASESWLLKMPVGVVVVDRHYHILTINRTARVLLSIRGPAIGEDILHVIQGVSYNSMRSVIDNAIRGGSQTSLDEFEAEDAMDGEARYLRVSCVPQGDENEPGPVESVMIVVEDITDLVRARKNLETQLQTAQADVSKHERMTGRLTETNSQLAEANQELTSVNEELQTTNEEFQLSVEEAQAATEEVETLNEELQATNEELETLNEELQATIEELNTTNDELQARSMELQQLARVSGEEKAQLEAILSSMSDAVVVIDTNGGKVLTNGAYDRTFGTADIAPQDGSGRDIPTEATPWQRAVRGESFSMEFSTMDEDANQRWYEVNGQPIHDSDGNLQGNVLVIRDITERSVYRLREEFIALAGHELRTPLTPIQSYLQMHLRHLRNRPDEAPPHRYVESALAQVRQLSRLINDLVDVTRLQSGKLNLEIVPLQLNEVVTQSVEVAQTMAKGQDIRLDIQDSSLTVNGDAGRIEQVLLNLLTNAINYAPETERIEVTLRRADNDAEIQVRDYGPGIPESGLPNLFTRFYQGHQLQNNTSGSGLGLGLYISREIVLAHGGTIHADSQSGEGTTITIHLPLQNT